MQFCKTRAPKYMIHITYTMKSVIHKFLSIIINAGLAIVFRVFDEDYKDIINTPSINETENSIFFLICTLLNKNSLSFYGISWRLYRHLMHAAALSDSINRGRVISASMFLFSLSSSLLTTIGICCLYRHT